MNVGSNIVWTAAEQSTRIVLVFFINIAIARSLGPVDYGILSTVFAVGAFLTGITAFGLDSVCIREIATSSSRLGKVAWETVLIRLCAASMVIVPVAVWCLWSRGDMFADSMLLLLALLPFQAAGSTAGNVFAAKLHSKYVTISLVTALVLVSGARIYGICSGKHMQFFVGCYFAEYCLASILTVWFLFRVYGKEMTDGRPTRKGLNLLIADSRWLLISTLAIQFLQNAGLFLMAKQTSGSELGNYAAAVRLVSMTQFMPAMVGQSFIPAVTKAHQENDNNLADFENQLFKCLALCAYGITVFCLFAGPWLLPWLLGAKYQAAIPSFMILASGSIPLSMGAARVAIFGKTRNYRAILVSDLSGAVLISALALALCSEYGSQGVAVATTIGYFFAYLIVPYFLMHEEPETRQRLYKALVSPFPNFRLLFKNSGIGG